MGVIFCPPTTIGTVAFPCLAMPSAIDSIPSLVKQLYAIVGELERLFHGRSFTPDGHLVGSIGEVYAAQIYGLTLFPASAKLHDGKIEKDGQEIPVQIKATQGGKVGLRGEPIHLIVLLLHKSGEPEEIYNGPGKYVWEEIRDKKQSNGQHPITIKRLRNLMSNKVRPLEALPKISKGSS